MGPAAHERVRGGALRLHGKFQAPRNYPSTHWNAPHVLLAYPSIDDEVSVVCFHPEVSKSHKAIVADMRDDETHLLASAVLSAGLTDNKVRWELQRSA